MKQLADRLASVMVREARFDRPVEVVAYGLEKGRLLRPFFLGGINMPEKVNAVIVEDDPYFAKVFDKMLTKSEKINVTGIFDSGEQFKDELKCGLSCEVAFLDLALPGIAGSEVGEYLRKERPDLQVVFVTGNVEFAVTAFDLEVTDYLVKPFDDQRLGRCITKVLNRIIKQSLKNEVYVITNKNGTVILDINDIIFIEKYRKNCIFHTTSGVYESYEKPWIWLKKN